jgi:hypothetical protein
MDQIEILERQREIMRRLSGVNLAEVTVNQSVVADAIETFLKALNRPVVPIMWARDSREAAALVVRAEQITPIDDVKVNPGTFREWFIRKEENWRNARDEAMTAAQSEVLQFVRDDLMTATQDQGNQQVWGAYGNALNFAARAYAECVWAREYYETEQRFRQYDIGEFERDWFPFVDAYEAGLWLFWLTGSEVIALPRPVVLAKGGQVHSENGAAVRWPEGREEYFVLNGVPVSREIVETPARELNPRLMLSEKNVNVRREIVRKIGFDRICRGLNAECIDSEGGYELLLLDLEDGRARPFLRMKDPSTGICHVDGVAPECRTVASALEWRNQTYVPPSVLT